MNKEWSSAQSIKKMFATKHLRENENKYVSYHSLRYEYLVKKVIELREKFGTEPVRILDIGPSFFTEILRNVFDKDEILTLGFDTEAERGGHFPEEILYDKRHHQYFNLIDCQFTEKWPDMEKVDIVVLAEVIEHLYIHPSFVLKFIKNIMNQDGFLVVQTPNALSLYKRLAPLLLSKNPYEMIREDLNNPGHFREYTMAEMKEIAELSGFQVYQAEYCNYYRRKGKKKVYDIALMLSPGSFWDGLSVVLSPTEK